MKGKRSEMQELENIINKLGYSQRPIVFIDLGENAIKEGKPDEAIYFFERARVIYERQGNMEMDAKVHEQIGDLYSQLGHEGERKRYMGRAGKLRTRENPYVPTGYRIRELSIPIEHKL